MRPLYVTVSGCSTPKGRRATAGTAMEEDGVHLPNEVEACYTHR